MLYVHTLGYARFVEHISVMFGERAPWDEQGAYTPTNIEVRAVALHSGLSQCPLLPSQVYYEDKPSQRLNQVPVESTLADVLSHTRLLARVLSESGLHSNCFPCPIQLCGVLRHTNIHPVGGRYPIQGTISQ